MAEQRIEMDSMGEMKVPADAYYGAQTARAVDNFPISGEQMPKRFIRAMVQIKKCAAKVNAELDLVPAKSAELIRKAADEVLAGKLADQFPVDIYQTGSGTSSNMNVNEVLASRANELATGKRGGKEPVHPNDHVNRGQSSNDVVPTAIHVAGVEAVELALLPAIAQLIEATNQKAKEFDKFVKIGRTHLQDAVPVRLGQEFAGYAQQLKNGAERIRAAIPRLAQLAISGTAVGTGLNTHPEFGKRMVAALSSETGLRFSTADNYFEALGSRDAVVEMSGALKTFAVSLGKIANDIRWLSSGPRCGLGEIAIPSTQPGSSIMPGKVNPVICESVLMVVARVIGNDATITMGGLVGGTFELNVMKPVLADALIESIELLASVTKNFTSRCMVGITANEKRCAELIEQSLAMCTALTPAIGYDKAAAIAKKAFQTGKTVRQIAIDETELTEQQIGEMLDPWSQTEPGIPSFGSAIGGG